MPLKHLKIGFKNRLKNRHLFSSKYNCTEKTHRSMHNQIDHIYRTLHPILKIKTDSETRRKRAFFCILCLKSLDALKAPKTRIKKKAPYADSLLIVDIFVKNRYPKFDTINISMKEFKNGIFENIASRTLNLHWLFLFWWPPKILLLHSEKIEY